MPELKDKLIVALDVATLKDTERFVDILYPTVKYFKVGSQLYTACGPEAVRMIGKKGAKVFLDLKWNDIPNTVFQSVSVGTGLACELVFSNMPSIECGVREVVIPPVFMMTVHIGGGKAMLEAAVRGATEKAKELTISKPFIVGVTRLTSDKNDKNTMGEVLKAARLAKDAGLDGVVCSVLEVPMIRKEFGSTFLIVAPGIRPKGYPSNDQARVATPEEAIAAGADFLVVGRPILEAKNPLLALEELLA